MVPPKRDGLEEILTLPLCANEQSIKVSQKFFSLFSNLSAWLNPNASNTETHNCSTCQGWAMTVEDSALNGTSTPYSFSLRLRLLHSMRKGNSLSRNCGHLQCDKICWLWSCHCTRKDTTRAQDAPQIKAAHISPVEEWLMKSYSLLRPYWEVVSDQRGSISFPQRCSPWEPARGSVGGVVLHPDAHR